MLTRHIRHTARLFGIALVLARHDALFPLEELAISPVITATCRLLARKNSTLPRGKRLAHALEELGPTFIKLGQALSTRADLIGEEMARDMADLQDNIPPFPAGELRAIIERDFARPLPELFPEFNDTPAAAASIAQVHFARTTTGDAVAVKVLRPGIEKAFARDLQLFFWLAELAERALPAWRRFKPVEVVQTFEQTVHFELDLRLEAAAAVELKNNMKNDEGFHVPRVYWDTTSSAVLTLERIDGIPISHTDKLKAAGHDLDRLVSIAAASFFNQVFRDGFFHADLHPGNLFVLANGDIAVVDFGIMGRVDLQSRIFLAEILQGFIREDYHRVAAVHIAAGYVPRTKSVDNFAQACMAIAKPILGRPLSEISVAKLLGQLFRVAEQFEMETQPQLLLLQKTMVLAEGVGRMLNPNVNMWQMAEPLVAGWIRAQLGPQAKVKLAAEEAAGFARKLPSLLREAEAALRLLNNGGIRLHPDSLDAIRTQRKRISRQWLAFAWAALTVAVVTMLLH